jgi:hypothetical protein
VLQSTPFLDIHTEVWTTGEAGLLSMAFDPNYGNQGSAGYGLFYVYYVEPPDSGSSFGDIHISEFSADPANTPNVANPASERLVLEIPHDDNSNHYGGTLHFGADGYLYAGTGDGGGSDNQYGNAQSTTKSLLGKIIRIDPHGSPYSIPAGNPYSGQPLCNPPSTTTNCPEIFALGLRNPFRWAFDSANGDVAIGDVGQSQYEEVDYVTSLAGKNFGWPCKEGPVNYKTCASPPPFADPVFWYSHTGLTGSVAITGGVVVRDPALWQTVGRYLWADFYIGEVHSIPLTTPTASGDRDEGLKVNHLVAFNEDNDHHVYVVSLDGPVYRLTEDTPPPTPPADQGAPPPDQGNPPPADTTTAPIAKDTRAPRLSVRAHHVQNVIRTGHVRLSIACDERCVARASGHGLRGSLHRLDAGKRVVVQMRAGRALAHRRSVVVSIRARDGAGNLATKSLTIRLRR